VVVGHVHKAVLIVYLLRVNVLLVLKEIHVSNKFYYIYIKLILNLLVCTGTSGNTGGNTSTTDNSVAVAIACGIVIPVVVIAIIIIIVCCLKKKAELELEQESNNVAVSGGAVSVVKPIGADDYANNMLNNNQGHSSGVSGGNMNLNANTHVNANVNASNSGHYAYTQYQPNNNKVDGTKTMSYGYDGNTDNVNVGVDYNAPIPSNAAYLGNLKNHNIIYTR